MFKIKLREQTYYVKTVVTDLFHSRLLRTKATIISMSRSPFICLCLDKNCNTICSLSLFRCAGTGLLQEVVYLVSQGADPDEIGLMNIDEQLPVLEYPQPGLDIIKVQFIAKKVFQHLSIFFLGSIFITSYHSMSLPFSSLDLLSLLE